MNPFLEFINEMYIHLAFCFEHENLMSMTNCGNDTLCIVLYTVYCMHEHIGIVILTNRHSQTEIGSILSNIIY